MLSRVLEEYTAEYQHRSKGMKVQTSRAKLKRFNFPTNRPSVAFPQSMSIDPTRKYSLAAETLLKFARSSSVPWSYVFRRAHEIVFRRLIGAGCSRAKMAEIISAPRLLWHIWRNADCSAEYV
jgi:hypothetical protein